MDIIYTVSPNYLEYIHKESADYDFYIQGYGDFNVATRSLITVNVSRILGYCILLEEIPEDITDIVYFIERVTLYGNGKPFVLVVKDKQGLELLMQYANFSGVKLFLYYDFEMVTDQVIRKCMFGTILKENMKPYVRSFYNEESEITFDYTRARTLEYAPLFSSYINDCLANIDIQGDFKRTVNMDKALKEMNNTSIYYHIRLLAISIALNSDVEYRDDIVKSALERLKKKNGQEYLQAKNVYEIVKERLIS